MTRNQKAVAYLQSCNIEAKEENDVVYVFVNDRQLEISNFEIAFNSNQYDIHLKEDN